MRIKHGFFCVFFIAPPLFADDLYPIKYNPPYVISTMRDYTENTPLVVMHRGGWNDKIPENSAHAFVVANINGTAMIETDVRLTSDNIPVIFHDSKLGRLSDVYKFASPEDVPFDPMTGFGYNPKISETPWNVVEQLNLLSHPGGTATQATIMSVSDFYDFYYENRLNLTVFLEIKDSKAIPILIKMLNEDTRDYYHGNGSGMTLKAKDFTLFKFNVNAYPMPEDYEALFAAQGVPCCYYALPSYKSNTYSDFDKKGIDMNASVNAWAAATPYTLSVEVGLKTNGGILQDVYDSLYGHTTLGIFNAVPDLMLANPDYAPGQLVPDIYHPEYIAASDAFYDGTSGQCCYRLNDLLSTWQDKADTQDQRSDVNYIVGTNKTMPAFRVVTTDKSQDMVEAFENAGFNTRPDTFGQFPGWSVLPLALPLLFP